MYTFALFDPLNNEIPKWQYTLVDDNGNVISEKFSVTDNFMAIFTINMVIGDVSHSGHFSPFDKIVEEIFSFPVEMSNGFLFTMVLTPAPIDVKSYVKSLPSLTGVDLTVAIDFTSSNFRKGTGFELDLHEHTESQSYYHDPIVRLLNIADNYDDDGSVEVYGFGLVKRSENRVLFDYHIDKFADPDDFSKRYIAMTRDIHFGRTPPPGVHPRDAINRDTGEKVEYALWGPTNITPFLETVETMCAGNPTNYQVVVIFTDGKVSDMVNTKRTIARMCRYPVSIVFCMVGPVDDDFAQMEELDGDGDNKYAPRDIVHSVRVNVRMMLHPDYFKQCIEDEIFTQIQKFVEWQEREAQKRANLAN